ncbi:MAG: methionyl-tRNA formyltransferase [Campylobacterota bacterium]|nr:methionyl-tRNA formyltransferase [Campylobacterota bacterium]
MDTNTNTKIKTNKSKNIIFMGTPDYATIILEQLLEEDYNIVALFTQPDKPVGRKQELTPPHIKQFIIDNGSSLPIYQPITLKEQPVVDTIKSLEPDMIIVAAYGQILPKAILDIAPCVNLHASLLPKYRGASPIQQCLLDDEKFTGVTAMFMEEGLDSGDILGLKYVEIKKDTVVAELFDMLSITAAKLTKEILNNYDYIEPKKQNLSFVSHCKKVKKTDGLVKFNNAKELYNKYRAYKTWPDIYIENGLKIKECLLNDIESSNNIGEILEIQNDFIIIGCKKGSIKILKVQPASKKQMNVVDYIRGQRLKVGDTIS